MAAQIPAPNRAGVDIHEHRQIDEVMLQAHVRDVCDPDHIGPRDHELCDQIGIARIGMLAVGRAAAPRGSLSGESQCPHEPADALAVRLPCLRGAIARSPADSHKSATGQRSADVRPQGLLRIIHLASLPSGVATAARHFQHAADHATGYSDAARASLRSPGAVAPDCEQHSFFATSSSSVSRPTMRSTSAMRCSACWRALVALKDGGCLRHEVGFPSAEQIGLELVLPADLGRALLAAEDFEHEPAL